MRKEGRLSGFWQKILFKRGILNVVPDQYKRALVAIEEVVVHKSKKTEFEFTTDESEIEGALEDREIAKRLTKNLKKSKIDKDYRRTYKPQEHGATIMTEDEFN